MSEQNFQSKVICFSVYRQSMVICFFAYKQRLKMYTSLVFLNTTLNERLREVNVYQDMYFSIGYILRTVHFGES